MEKAFIIEGKKNSFILRVNICSSDVIPSGMCEFTS